MRQPGLFSFWIVTTTKVATKSIIQMPCQQQSMLQVKFVVKITVDKSKVVLGCVSELVCCYSKSPHVGSYFSSFAIFVAVSTTYCGALEGLYFAPCIACHLLMIDIVVFLNHWWCLLQWNTFLILQKVTNLLIVMIIMFSIFVAFCSLG